MPILPKPLAALLAASALLSACSQPFVEDDEGHVCPAVVTPGVEVLVPGDTDQFDPQRSRIIVKDGSYTDSASFFGQTIINNGVPKWFARAADERAGTYTVTVRSPGFADQVFTNVVVTDRTCGVNTARLDVTLQPAGA